jgi:hypothetical protein
MMTYEEAIGRLFNHANFPKRPADLRHEESLLYALWKARKEGAVYSATVLWDDVLSCLEAVNRKLNGERPSASGTEQKANVLDRLLVIAVSTILHHCFEEIMVLHKRQTVDRAFREDLLKKVWRISCAWEAILNGDIDSLCEHVALEEQAREL